MPATVGFHQRWARRFTDQTEGHRSTPMPASNSASTPTEAYLPIRPPVPHSCPSQLGHSPLSPLGSFWRTAAILLSIAVWGVAAIGLGAAIAAFTGRSKLRTA